jgi:hypothetical protein
MTEYLIISPSLGENATTGQRVAVKTNGASLEVVGPKTAVDYWSDLFASSIVLASYVKDNQVTLQSFASGFTYSDLLWFDDSTYDAFKTQFESIKGAKRIVKLERVAPVDEPDFSQAKVKRFMEKAARIQERRMSQG